MITVRVNYKEGLRMGFEHDKSVTSCQIRLVYTDRHTDRQTDRQRHRQAERQRGG